MMEHPTGNLDAKKLLSILERVVTPEPKGSGRASLPIAWATSRGLVRSENQDRILVANGHTGIVIAVLADGMGGMQGGTRAAALTVSAITAYCIAARPNSIEVLLMGALHSANQEVYQIFRGSGGAAVVLAAMEKGRWYVAHAGDARAYHISNDGQLKQITIDDTIKGQLKDQGRTSDQESALHSQLLQFIGMGKDLEAHISAVPTGGRGLLLTSDGVHAGMPSSVMDWIVAKTHHLQEAVKRLVEVSEWGGGRDNASVIAVSFQNTNNSDGMECFAEFWTPSDHHLTIHESSWQPPALERLRAQPHVQPRERLRAQPDDIPNSQPVEGKPNNKTGQKKNKGKRSRTESRLPRQHQIPIVEFGQEKVDTSSVKPNTVEESSADTGKPELPDTNMRPNKTGDLP